MSKRKQTQPDYAAMSIAEQSRMMQGNVHQVSIIVSNQHCGTPDSEIAADMTERAQRVGLTAYMTRKLVAIALAVHHDNNGLYRKVVSGKF